MLQTALWVGQPRPRFRQFLLEPQRLFDELLVLLADALDRLIRDLSQVDRQPLLNLLISLEARPRPGRGNGLS